MVYHKIKATTLIGVFSGTPGRC